MGDKPVHLFTTELANQAIQVVKIDRFQNIVAFHCSLEETKRFLSNYAQQQQNNLSKQQQTPGSLDGGKMGGQQDTQQGQILTPAATTSSGRKFAPPPNVKLENPMQPPTPTGGFKREYSSLSSPFSDAPPLMLSNGPLTPYGGGGADTSNLPITDTHFGNYSSNGDPLEKMARLTQEALPYDPPLKQPKLEPNEICQTGGKPNLTSSNSIVNKCINNDSQSQCSSSLSCDDQLTPSQRQHRLERLQTIEGLKMKKGGGARFAPQQPQPMPNFMPVMQCVPPPNVSLDVGMMPGGPTSSFTGARAMTPPNFALSGVAGMPPRLPMLGGVPMPPGAKEGGPPATTANEKRSRTPRSSTPKNKNAASGGNNNGPPTTMMVQGKPAVMVHPNQTAKSSRSTVNRSNSTSFPPQEKFFGAAAAGLPPPNVTFGGEPQNFDPNFQPAFFQNAGPPQWNTGPPQPAAAAAATLVFGGGGGPRAPQPAANVNLNMNIQINAQPPGGAGGQDLMMAGGGQQMTGGQHMRFIAPGAGGGQDFMGSRIEDDIFYDPMPFNNRGSGQGMCPAPPNVNIAVTGIYPPPGQQQQGPPCFMDGGQDFGGGGGQMMMNPNDQFFQQGNFGMMDPGCRPPQNNDVTFQQRKTSTMQPGGSSFTMSIQHNVNMQNGPYNPMSPQMAPWSQQSQQLCRPPSQGPAPTQPQPCFPMRGPAPPPPRLQTAASTPAFDDFQKTTQGMGRGAAAAAGPLSDPQNVQYEAQYKNFQQQLYSNSNNNGPTST